MDTELAELIRHHIGEHGPISVHTFMKLALTHPNYGYYRTQQAIGRSGDFITAPEISQVFGELIGLWCVAVWQSMGEPTAFNLIEWGPGRGTLLQDALRAARVVPRFLRAVHVHLREINPALRAQQAATLAGAGVPVTWATEPGDVETFGETPVILLANEFLDAMPVEQFVWVTDGAAAGWRQRTVEVGSDGELRFGIGARLGPSPGDLADPGGRPTEGSILETRAHEFQFLTGQFAAMAKPGLAALFIDYAHERAGLGESLNGIRAHKIVSPLSRPGETDISADVDFGALAGLVRAHHEATLTVDGPVPQAVFLGRLGAAERASRLMAANPALAGEIEMGLARLLAPQGMGGRFHVMGVRSRALPPLPGLGQGLGRA